MSKPAYQSFLCLGDTIATDALEAILPSISLRYLLERNDSHISLQCRGEDYGCHAKIVLLRVNGRELWNVVEADWQHVNQHPHPFKAFEEADAISSGPNKRPRIAARWSSESKRARTEATDDGIDEEEDDSGEDWTKDDARLRPTRLDDRSPVVDTDEAIALSKTLAVGQSFSSRSDVVAAFGAYADRWHVPLRPWLHHNRIWLLFVRCSDRGGPVKRKQRCTAYFRVTSAQESGPWSVLRVPFGLTTIREVRTFDCHHSPTCRFYSGVGPSQAPTQTSDESPGDEAVKQSTQSHDSVDHRDEEHTPFIVGQLYQSRSAIVKAFPSMNEWRFPSDPLKWKKRWLFRVVCRGKACSASVRMTSGSHSGPWEVRTVNLDHSPTCRFYRLSPGVAQDEASQSAQLVHAEADVDAYNLLDYDSLDEMDDEPAAPSQRPSPAFSATPAAHPLTESSTRELSSSIAATPDPDLATFLRQLDYRLDGLAPTLIDGGLSDRPAALVELSTDGLLDGFLAALGISILNRVILKQRLAAL